MQNITVSMWNTVEIWNKVLTTKIFCLDLQFGADDFELQEAIDDENDVERLFNPSYPGSTANRELYFDFEP